VKEGNSKFYKLDAMIVNVKFLLAREWEVCMHHTLRKVNAYANFSGKHDAKNHDLFKVWDIHPLGLDSLLMPDSLGTNFRRAL